MTNDTKDLPPLRLKSVVFTDTETTGLLDNPVAEVIELAVVGVGGEVLLNTKIKPVLLDEAMKQNPEGTKKALEINGYNETDWASAPTFEELAPEIVKVFEHKVIVGQNCLTEDSQVLLADGQRLRLGHMVRTKHPGPVLSLDESTSMLEAQPVIGWIKAPARSYEDWLRIRVRGKGVLRLTKDHEVITEKGRVQAQDIEVGDKIFTSNRRFSRAKKDLCWGTLAGDASLIFPESSRSPYLEFGHCLDQEAYARLKAEVLGDLVADIRMRLNDRGYGEGSENKLIVVRTHNDPRLHEMRNICFPEGEKRMTKAWLREMSDAALAIWYCDDGGWDGGKSRRASICTQRLGGAVAADLVIAWMRARGWPAYLYLRPDGYPYVRVDGAGRWQEENGVSDFWDKIARFIPLCMAHKVPPSFRDLCSNRHWTTEDDQGAWSDEVVEVGPLFLDEGAVKISRYSGYTRRKGKRGVGQYCLVVEKNANFFAGGLCVSNCNFDRTFIVRGLERAGIEKAYRKLSRHVIDTTTLAWEHLVPCGLNRLNLDAICEFLGVPLDRSQRHGALEDTQACRAAYLMMLRATEEQRFAWRERAKKLNL